ncbi:MAG: TonB-dependent receptor domain-containing protein, partial [Flavobacteriales bacterium]
NANTYTHQSNLTTFNFSHYINDKWNIKGSIGRLFTNLRADANGRPFREETVDEIKDPRSIVSEPVKLFNPKDSLVFPFPGPGVMNNGGIATLWHDHYAKEWTFKASANHYPKNKHHELEFGIQHKLLEYQWIDVTRPWVGAPIKINDSVSTPSVSIGTSNDIWHVKPNKGGMYIKDKITYKRIIATLGMRLNYWAPGKFADNAVNDPNTLMLDKVRKDYKNETFKMLGLRYKARLLPKLNVSFPVTDNYTMYFNYGHSMRLPHPRFLYAGLDPKFQDRSFLSRLGNPNLDPEVSVSYELGLKAMVNEDLGFTLTAYNNDKFDYVVTRTIQIRDQTGRFVNKTFNINQDFAKIVGVELGVNKRFGKLLKINFNGSYQVATGKSNSAAESLLQIKNNGSVNTTKERFLAWDRPFNLKLSVIFSGDSTMSLFGMPLKNFNAFLNMNFKSGMRYTPHKLVDTNDLGRPLYERIPDKRNAEVSKPWFWTDLRLIKDFPFKNKNAVLSLSIKFSNLFDSRNGQIINPVTGEAYRRGDPVPSSWRDPEHPDPQASGTPPTNPARFKAPLHIMYGISFKF